MWSRLIPSHVMPFPTAQSMLSSAVYTWKWWKITVFSLFSFWIFHVWCNLKYVKTFSIRIDISSRSRSRSCGLLSIHSRFAYRFFCHTDTTKEHLMSGKNTFVSVGYHFKIHSFTFKWPWCRLSAHIKLASNHKSDNSTLNINLPLETKSLWYDTTSSIHRKILYNTQWHHSIQRDIP